MRMWEIREGDYNSHYGKRMGMRSPEEKAYQEGYECGYEEGYEAAMKEADGYSKKDHSYGERRYR